MKDVKKRMVQIIGLVLVLGVFVIIVNFLFVVFNGKSIPAPYIERKVTTIGNGKPLKYLILGDSTTVAQGGDYAKGYAVQTAEKLAENYTVSYVNYGESGATVGDVLRSQLPKVMDSFKPDVVLVGAGANDVTHLTSLSSLRSDLYSIVDELQKLNSEVTIIFTGAASMGDVKRFTQPLKWLAGIRTKQINDVFIEVVNEKNMTFAYVAEKTAQNFSNNPQYFAADNFHPNNMGYEEWTRVLNEVIGAVVSKH